MDSEKIAYLRRLKLQLPQGQSAFLWGPRKTGKTTFLEKNYPDSTTFDLLKKDLHLKYSKEPHLFREEILYLLKEKQLTQPILVDEVQKIPDLLDEVHSLIEKHKLQFILCGSSARKLKRVGANLLGGRAWRYELHPLSCIEIGKDFDLLHALNAGLVPGHYLSKNYQKSLEAYLYDYLKEEIQQEAAIRNLQAFSRFLDAASFSNAQMVNYSNIARECGIDSKTVKEYYQVLSDTFLGYLIEPFRKTRKRQVITETPKFYFFDIGLANFLSQKKITALKGEEFGNSFEHFIFMELVAYHSYADKMSAIQYWRTSNGYEVDFVLGKGTVAIEVKGSERVDISELKGLNTFIEDYKPQKAFVVCQTKAPLLLENGTQILPWKIFIEKLWKGEVV